MTVSRICGHCGSGPTARHAVRAVDVPVPGLPAWGWVRADIVRMMCPACRRTTEPGRDLVEGRLEAARCRLVAAYDAEGLAVAARLSGLDARTVCKWVDRALDDGLVRPLPRSLRMLSTGNGGPVILLDAGTGQAFDAAPLDPEALALCLGRHGGQVVTAWISIDAHIRDALEATYPNADVRGDPAEGTLRLSAIARNLDATVREVETSLILADVARLGWSLPRVETLRRLCARHGAKRAATYLALWGGMIGVGLDAVPGLATIPDVSGYSGWSPRRFRAALLVHGGRWPELKGDGSPHD